MIPIPHSNSETITSSAVVSFFSHTAVYAFLLYSLPEMMQPWRYLNMLVLFGVFAFALCPLYGLLADLTENPYRMAQCGVMLQLCGIFFPYHWEAEFLDFRVASSIKVLLLGLGFGLFHTFAGMNILRRDGGKARDIGFFLAPGVLGLAAALVDARLGFYCLPLLALSACMPDRCKPKSPLPEPKSPKKGLFPRILTLFGGILALCAFALTASALPSLDTLDRGNRKELLLLALALCAGRAIGGLLFDYFGAISGIFALIGGVLMIKGEGKLLILGIFLLATALPALMRTLTDVMKTPGIAFGLCSATLFPVAWLVTRESTPAPLGSGIAAGLAAVIALTAVCFAIGKKGILLDLLTKMRKKTPEKEENT